MLFIKAPTRLLNPKHKKSIRDRMGDLFKGRTEDPNLEWEAEFRDVTEGFLNYDTIVENMTRRMVLMPDPDVKYLAFIDSAGGARATGDAYALAIGHREPTGRVVVDYIEQTRPPFDVVEVTKKYAEIVRRFGCWFVTADNFASEFLTAAWREHGRLKVEKTSLSASDLYLSFQQRLKSGLVELPMDETLKLQLQQLRVVREPAGRVRVDHPGYGNTHDDLANATAGCVHFVATTDVALSAVEMEAKMPRLGEHRADRVLSPSIKTARKAEEIRRDNEKILDEWMRESGGSRIVRR